jgi:hypothetical protein
MVLTTQVCLGNPLSLAKPHVLVFPEGLPKAGPLPQNMTLG